MTNGRADMTEPNEPDKKKNETESTTDEAIIELEEEAAGGPKGDEEIIDLLEAVEEQEPVEDEAIIELKEETIDEPKGDEEIIDLLEAAEESPQEIEDIGEPISEAAAASHAFDDIDELDNDLIKETVDFADELDTDATIDDALEDDFADSLGIELDSKEDFSGDLIEADRITDEKIEAALERVIKKVFYEKIDRILAGAIEKSVTREIEKLKKALLEDPPGGEK